MEQTNLGRVPRSLTDEAHVRFLAAFKELYAINGMKGISAATLSAKTGYSRSTFYRYYESVYDLLILVETEATPYQNMQFLRDNWDTIGMVEITNAFLYAFAEKQDLIRMLTKFSDDNRYYERMRECIYPVFRQQAERVYIMEPEEYDVLAEYLTTAKLALLRAWALREVDMGVGHMTQITDSVLEGGFWDRVEAAAQAKKAGIPYERTPLSYFVDQHPWIANRALYD
ncbi:MAG: TetR/AcrR family transcriptional regulator [Coriobacteriaceae bacterium]|nr:TetR/AcrR family transcriptional regulator [Coriobacteriaceae bacterium]